MSEARSPSALSELPRNQTKSSTTRNRSCSRGVLPPKTNAVAFRIPRCSSVCIILVKSSRRVISETLVFRRQQQCAAITRPERVRAQFEHDLPRTVRRQGSGQATIGKQETGDCIFSSHGFDRRGRYPVVPKCFADRHHDACTERPA